MFLYILNSLFTVYKCMLAVRILGSWFTRFAQSRFMRVLQFYTDPYLDLFRKMVPPVGMLDISPLFALMALQLLQFAVNYFL